MLGRARFPDGSDRKDSRSRFLDVDLYALEVAGQVSSLEPIVDEDVETRLSAYHRESHADKSAGRRLI
jgi:hypothetical protein